MNSLHWQDVAGFGDDAFVGAVGESLLVGVEVGVDVGGELAVGAVIDESADGNFLDELGHPADVVEVIVSDQNIIELRDAGALRGSGDAIGVAALVVGPAGVDEKRLSGRGDEEGRLASFNIDEIDLERL